MNVQKKADQSKGKKKKESVASLVDMDVQSPKKKEKKKLKKIIQEDFSGIYSDSAEFVQTPPKTKKSEKMHIQEDFNLINRSSAEPVQTSVKKKKPGKLDIQDNKGMDRSILDGSLTSSKKKKHSPHMGKHKDISTESDALMSSPQVSPKKRPKNRDKSFDADPSLILSPTEKKHSSQLLKHLDISSESDLSSILSPKKRKYSSPNLKHQDIFPESGIVSFSSKNSSKKKKVDTSSVDGDTSMTQKMKKEVFSQSGGADKSEDGSSSSLDGSELEKIEEITIKDERFEEFEADQNEMEENETYQNEMEEDETYQNEMEENETDQNEMEENETDQNEMEENESDLTEMEENEIDPTEMEENEIDQKNIRENKNKLIKETTTQIYTDTDLFIQRSNLTFLESLLEYLKPTNASYSLEISKFDFTSLSEKLELSPDECKEHLKELIQKTPKFKCLHQIVSETLVNLPKKKPPTSFSLFLRKNLAKVNETMRLKNMSNRLEAAAFLWNNLSQEKKNLYKKEKKMKDETRGKSPLMLFYEKQRDKGLKVNICIARQRFGLLKPEKKIKYIIKSLKLLLDPDQPDQEPEIATLRSSKVSIPSKNEIKFLLEYYNFPEQPPKVPALIYFNQNTQDFPGHDLLAGSEKLVTILKTFRKLRPNIQKLWVQKHKQLVDHFMEDVKAWKEQQPPSLRLAASLYLSAGFRKPSTVKKAARFLIEELSYITMADIKINFPDEPSPLPIVRKKCFLNDMKEKGGEKMTQAYLKEAYSNLDVEMRRVYDMKAKLNRSIMTERLLKFVADLPDDQRKMFLGTRRIKYIKYFNEDIFHSKYPSTEFPVYKSSLKPTPRPKKKRAKKPSSAKAKIDPKKPKVPFKDVETSGDSQSDDGANARYFNQPPPAPSEPDDSDSSDY